MILLIILVIGTNPIEINKDVIYSPELEAEVDQKYFSGKNIGLSYLRLVDSITDVLLRDVVVELRPLEKKYFLKEGRAKFALKPGVYVFSLTKTKYYKKERKIRIIPDSIDIVTIKMSKTKEVLEEEARKIKVDSLLIVGTNFLNQDSLIMARDIFEDVILLDSTNQNAQNYLAETNQRISGIIEGYINQADSVLRRWNFEETIDIWKKVLVYDTTNQVVKDTIAKLEEEMKKQLAKNVITKEDVENYFRNGVRQFTKGNYTAAYQLFKKVLRYNPNHSAAKSYLRRTEVRLKK